MIMMTFSRCLSLSLLFPSRLPLSLAQARYQAELMMLYVQAIGIPFHHNNNNNLGILQEATFNTFEQGFVLDRKKKE